MPQKLLSYDSDINFEDGSLAFAVEEDENGPDIAAEYLTDDMMVCSGA